MASPVQGQKSKEQKKNESESQILMDPHDFYVGLIDGDGQKLVFGHFGKWFLSIAQKAFHHIWFSVSSIKR